MSDAPQDGERPDVSEVEQGRQEIRFMLDDRHRDEWELVHGAYGVEELPSELDARHKDERASLEKRLDLLPPKPGEFATLDDFMRASEPALQNEIVAGMAEVRAMRDAAVREDVKLWHEDSDWDDPTRQQLRQYHKEFHADIEHRLWEYQPMRGEFSSLDAFMSATEHLATHEEGETDAPRAAPLTVEAIEHDPWNVLRSDLPENPPRELIAAIAEAAHGLLYRPEEMPPPPADFLDHDGNFPAEEFGPALKTVWKDAGEMLREFDTRHTAEAVSIRDGEAVAEVAPEAPVRGFFSFWGATENLAERAARVVDITFGAVIGFFVDEPKMTAAQVHDTLQAAGNVETVHAREVAVAEAIEAGAHETRMLEMKGGQQEHDLRLAMTLGTNATAEANIGLDEHEGARRTQKLAL